MPSICLFWTAVITASLESKTAASWVGLITLTIVS